MSDQDESIFDNEGETQEFPDFSSMKKGDLTNWIDEAVASDHIEPAEAKRLVKLKVKDLRTELKSLFGDPDALDGKNTTGVDPSDPIHKAVIEAQQLGDIDAAVAVVHDLQEGSEYDMFRMGAVLAHMQVQGWTGDYEDFYSFAKNTFGLEQKTVKRRIKVYSAVTSSGASWTEAKAVGWTKLCIAADHFGPDDYQGVFEEIAPLSKRETQEWVADKNPEKKTTKGASKDRSFSFKVYDDDKADLIDSALEQIMEETGDESKAEALYNMALNYMNSEQAFQPDAAPEEDQEQAEAAGAAEDAEENDDPWTISEAVECLHEAVQNETGVKDLDKAAAKLTDEQNEAILEGVDAVLMGDIQHFPEGMPEEDEDDFLGRLRESVNNGDSNESICEEIDGRLQTLGFEEE